MADAEKRVPSVFPRLGTLTLSGVDFRSTTMVSRAIDLICDSPNLEDLMIVSEYNDEVPPPALCSSEVDFKRMEQLQLQLKNVIFGSYNMSRKLFLDLVQQCCSARVPPYDSSSAGYVRFTIDLEGKSQQPQLSSQLVCYGFIVGAVLKQVETMTMHTHG
ncbi:F-box domain, Leucine-rich repeat domain, L domain-like protein [Artemisia annua]|uniref:F-box domain, Leucine-rich repeat domain, L domain-like protein n=1 Tax=Artemisia annua TaxID=35608 RepID=A0A2U1NJZ9_ARTAN|nr:F-box domain, Leucine-rich repeat domain, L domain-like protein [Artemisia annua]